MNLIYFLPLIAAFIGWLTNYLAIKMLFHPKEPVNLGFFTLQGVFPKRQEAFAQQIGKIIAEELISVREINDAMEETDLDATLKSQVEAHVDDFIEKRFTKKFPMLANFVTEDVLQKFKKVLMEELDILMPDIIETYTMKLQEEVDLQAIISGKVARFSSDKLESMLFRIMSKEFRFVEFIGALVGFIIGLVQVAILQL